MTEDLSEYKPMTVDEVKAIRRAANALRSAAVRMEKATTRAIELTSDSMPDENIRVVERGIAQARAMARTLDAIARKGIPFGTKKGV